MQHHMAERCSNSSATLDLDPPVNPQAGVALKAVDALNNPDVQHFTRAQVAHLIQLAFLSGAEHRRAFDVAELIATWDVNTPPRCTRRQRIAWELAEYERLEDLRRAREAFAGPRRPRLTCDWPEVRQPGTGLAEAA